MISSTKAYRNKTKPIMIKQRPPAAEPSDSFFLAKLVVIKELKNTSSSDLKPSIVWFVNF